MTAFYNENDPFAAAWLRELIAAGLIAPGVVDERDIQQLKGVDLGQYTQVHLFAGIGGWSLALRLAGIADDFPVWTGSCPCQPFSSAGKQNGKKDARHLWPWMRHLMFRWRPAKAFGEQVASNLGREWLAGVRANLETLGYAVGAADLCAAGVAAPHIRQRLFWVADAEYGRSTEQKSRAESWPQGCRVAGGLADAECAPRWTMPERRQLVANRDDGGRSQATSEFGIHREAGRLEHSPRDGREQWGAESGWRGIVGGCEAGGLGDTSREGLSEQIGNGEIQCETVGPLAGQAAERGSHANFWSDFDLIPCRDNKTRRVESGVKPLAHGVSDRVGKLRGYGNAIVPEVAAAFIEAYMTSINWTGLDICWWLISPTHTPCAISTALAEQYQRTKAFEVFHGTYEQAAAVHAKPRFQCPPMRTAVQK